MDDVNFMMMANGDVYYFMFGSHEQHLHSLIEQYGLGHTGSDGYGLVTEHEYCEEHNIISCHGGDTFRYCRKGLTNDQVNALNREVALGHIDKHLVEMLNSEIEFWKE